MGQSPNLADEGRTQTLLQLEDLSGCLIYKAAPQLLANLEAVKRRQQWRRVRAGDDTFKSLVVARHITAIIRLQRWYPGEVSTAHLCARLSS